MYPNFKRVLDMFASVTGLILILPLLLIIFFLILIFLGKPVIYKQRRPGKNLKIFEIYKFRTMTNETDENGKLMPDEKRITKFGRFLRKTSIDELPELINVIKGDMSFVGPRPLLVDYIPCYTSRENRRHDVLPGITGLAQISGRNFLDWDKRLELDVLYVESLSFYLDFKILIKTITHVINFKDVSVNSSDVEPSLLDLRTNKNK